MIFHYIICFFIGVITGVIATIVRCVKYEDKLKAYFLKMIDELYVCRNSYHKADIIIKIKKMINKHL